MDTAGVFVDGVESRSNTPQGRWSCGRGKLGSVSRGVSKCGGRRRPGEAGSPQTVFKWVAVACRRTASFRLSASSGEALGLTGSAGGAVPGYVTQAQPLPARPPALNTVLSVVGAVPFATTASVLPAMPICARAFKIVIYCRRTEASWRSE